MRWRAVVVGNVFSSSFTKLCVWNGGFSYVGVIDDSVRASPGVYGVISLLTRLCALPEAFNGVGEEEDASGWISMGGGGDEGGGG
jgi:hypothetical protein